MTAFFVQDVFWLQAADAVVKATLLLAGAALGSTLLRRGSAAARHLVWTLALLGVLVLPALSLWLPRWPLPVVTLTAGTASEGKGPAESSPSLSTPQARRAAIDTTMPPMTEDSANAPAAAGGARAAIAGMSWQTWLLLAWFAGMLAIAGRLALGMAAVHWLRRSTAPAHDAPWINLACRLASDLGVSSRLRFRRSSRAAMPMACGIFRPAILMPADADSWPSERLRIVLLHELAHVKRRDCLTHALAQLACALYWFNPLAWIAARHLRTERERACDDLVIAAGTRGPDYADQLLEIARVMRTGRFPAVVAGASLAMAYRSQLEGRLMAILDPKVPRAGVTRVRAAAATVFAAAALLSLASVQPWAYVQADVGSDVDARPAAHARTAAKGAQPQEVDAPIKVSAPPPAVPAPRERAVARQEQDVVQGVIQGTTQGVVQGIVQGMTQGVTRGVIGGIAGALPIAAAGIEQAESGERRSGADPRTIAALTGALKDPDRGVRHAALQALVRLREPSIYEPLVAALGDSSADLRQQAAFGLGQLGDRRAVPALTAALKDEAADVRQQAVFALGQLRDPAAVDAIAAAVRDPHADVRQQAVFALGQLRDRRAVEPLISALKDAAADVREQAAFALGQLRDRAAVEPLVIALKDGRADVRQQAAFALGQLRDARAIDGLTALLKDQSADVRQQAAFALGQIAR